ncbi:MAG TPA: hypothetical protein VHC86_08695 [Opitutaceae bacterium]|nr:hypothetical protein [Opitutaceae bacterium]
MRLRQLLWPLLGAGCLLAPRPLPAQPASAADPQIQALIEQNRRLLDQLQAQQKTIDALSARLAQVDQANARQQDQLDALSRRLGAEPAPGGSGGGAADREVRLSAEAGVGWFNSGARGQSPNAEFRVDEVRVFLEAPVWKNVYAFLELDPRTREANGDETYLGQFYLDFENVSGAWGADDLLNLRAGRFSIPFGEEYQFRDAVDNPLVSHSLSDLWGFDSGLEAYGRYGRWQYAVAVQDGGQQALGDFNPDKSVAGRVGYDPAGWLHLSASAMRTGRLSAGGDALSAVWFGNGFFRALGPTATEFAASLYELDAAARWAGGTLRAAGGAVRFGDNVPGGADSRRMTYYYLEGTRRLGGGLSAAMRFSRISAPRGYPLAGEATLGGAFFSSHPATELDRLSFGLDYQFGPPLVLKLEYSPEWGRTLAGQDRENEDLLATELGVKF